MSRSRTICFAGMGSRLAVLTLGAAALLGAVRSAASETYALLVAVDRQPPATEPGGAIFPPLAGPVNDVRTLREVLVREYGVKPGCVETLENERAKLPDIREAFARLARLAQPGDRVVFHYSGHGTSVPDDDGDEQDDSLDEALCVYDCGPKMERVLRDDELGRLLDSLRASHVVVILDCCHSGTATRSLDGPKTTARRFVPGPIDRPAKSVAPLDRAPDPARLREASRVSSDTQRLVFSACTAAQQAYEVAPVSQAVNVQCGSLTYFLVEGLRGPADIDGDGRVTYAEALQHATRRIDSLLNGGQPLDSQRQTPQLEASPPAAAAENVLLASRKRPFFALATPGVAANVVRLDLGVIHGLKPGQRLGLFRLAENVPQFGDPLGDMVIRTVDAESADAELNAGAFALPVAGPMAAAPITDPLDTPDIRLALRTARDPNGGAFAVAHDLSIRLTSRLGDEPRLRIVEDAVNLELHLEQTRRAVNEVEFHAMLTDGAQFERRAEPERLETILGDDQRERIRFDARADAVVERTIEWFRVQVAEYRLRKLVGECVNPRPGFGVQLVTNGSPRPGETMTEFRAGDRIKAAVRSSADCWIYLFAIDPKGKVESWYAPEANDPLLFAKQKALFPGQDRFFEPREPGVYVLKLIATKNRLREPLVRDGRFQTNELRQLSPDDWSESSYAFRLTEPRIERTSRPNRENGG